MTTQQTKWWWPIFKPWEIKQSFKQKLLVFFLFVSYFTTAILSSADTQIFGSPTTCISKNENITIIDTCHPYDLDKNKCELHSMCRITYNEGAIFGILFVWVGSLYMFIGFCRTIVWPVLKGGKMQDSVVIPQQVAMTHREYDAL